MEDMVVDVVKGTGQLKLVKLTEYDEDDNGEAPLHQYTYQVQTCESTVELTIKFDYRTNLRVNFDLQNVVQLSIKIISSCDKGKNIDFITAENLNLNIKANEIQTLLISHENGLHETDTYRYYGNQDGISPVQVNLQGQIKNLRSICTDKINDIYLFDQPLKFGYLKDAENELQLLEFPNNNKFNSNTMVRLFLEFNDNHEFWED